MNTNNITGAREVLKNIIETHGWGFVLSELRNWVSLHLIWKEQGNETLKFALGRLDNIIENIND